MYHVRHGFFAFFLNPLMSHYLTLTDLTTGAFVMADTRFKKGRGCPQAFSFLCYCYMLESFVSIYFVYVEKYV